MIQQNFIRQELNRFLAGGTRGFGVGRLSVEVSKAFATQRMLAKDSVVNDLRRSKAPEVSCDN